MKKLLFFVLILIITLGCGSFKINLALDLIGIYDDSAELHLLKSDQREIVFIPMHHIGTKLFYDDIKNKVDSLENLGFYFYTEMVKGDKKDTLSKLKYRKITGMPISKNNKGYLEVFDSVYKGKIKYKKEIINQPKYYKLGVDSLKSKTVDVTMKVLIDYYESKYGIINLEKCDYETSIFQKSVCKDKRINKKAFDDVVLHFRNKNVLTELSNDTHSKIAIIYGAKHFIGIKEELLKLGYKQHSD